MRTLRLVIWASIGTAGWALLVLTAGPLRNLIGATLLLGPLAARSRLRLARTQTLDTIDRIAFAILLCSFPAVLAIFERPPSEESADDTPTPRSLAGRLADSVLLAFYLLALFAVPVWLFFGSADARSPMERPLLRVLVTALWLTALAIEARAWRRMRSRSNLHLLEEG